MDHSKILFDKRLKTVFKMFDLNRDGVITFKELQQSMMRNGQSITHSQLVKMFDDMDVDKDGSITY